MKLNTIRDNRGARKQSMRVGRGYGSGKGRTAGRGVKGQKSRTGVSVNGFEGGQMPIFRRLPKRGFHNIFRLKFVELNLGALQKAFDSKLLDAQKEVNGVALMEAGMIKNVKDGIRLLGKGTLTTKAVIRVAGATKSAAAAVEKIGGQLIVEPVPKTVLEKGKKTSQKEKKKTLVKKKKA